MTTREDLLKIQRQITERVKWEVRHYLEPITSAIRTYFQEYKREFRSYRRISNKSELMERIMESDVVYVGDFHAFRQSQRMLLRLLRDLHPQRKKMIVAVEAVLQQYQHHLDSYLAGKMREHEFLQAIDYQERWGFDWNNFKPIFEFCRYHKIPMAALNIPKEEGLEKRDQGAADVIVKTLVKYPGHLLFVQYGDLHFARSHIPDRVDKLLTRHGEFRQRLIIYQNSESIYWKLAEHGMEQDVDVVYLGNDRFCVQNSPPWLKWQSYLHFAERSDEINYAWRQGEWGEKGEENHLDYTDQVFHFIQTIAEFLDIHERGLDHFSVYVMGDLAFISKLKQMLSAEELEIVTSLILSSSSFFIPGANIVYLSDLSVNHAAEEAAEFLYACCSKVKHLPVDPMMNFYTMIIWEALGFFGSKLINHKRPATPLREFMTQVRIFKGKRVSPLLRIKRVVAQGVIEVKEREKEFLATGKFRQNIPKKFIKNPQIRFRVASEIGYMLGEKLHGAMIAEIYTREMIRDLFYNPLTNEGQALDMYLKWVKELKDITPKYKSKKQYL